MAAVDSDSGSFFFFCCYFGFLPLLLMVRSGARLINACSFSVFPCSLCLRSGDEGNAGFCSLLLYLFSLPLPVSSVLPPMFCFCFRSCSPFFSPYFFLRLSLAFYKARECQWSLTVLHLQDCSGFGDGIVGRRRGP